MASPIQWKWTWANSRRCWGTGRTGVLQSMGLQRVGHNLEIEQQQHIIYITLNIIIKLYILIWLEKEMATHSSTLAWKIPWTEEPGGLQSMGSLRVGHDWAPSLSLFTFTHWRRKWQPTPMFLPGESQGQGSLVGCHLRGRRESDTNEAT